MAHEIAIPVSSAHFSSAAQSSLEAHSLLPHTPASVKHFSPAAHSSSFVHWKQPSFSGTQYGLSGGQTMALQSNLHLCSTQA
ncbi:MAG: hypothetical protein ABIH03_11290 [Pseudomonadota bacterium]